MPLKAGLLKVKSFIGAACAACADKARPRIKNRILSPQCSVLVFTGLRCDILLVV
jgi:hypothetical protein